MREEDWWVTGGAGADGEKKRQRVGDFGEDREKKEWTVGEGRVRR